MKNKASELIKLNDKELDSLLIEANEKLEKVRIDKATGALTDTSVIRKNRKLIARILTIKHNKKEV